MKKNIIKKAPQSMRIKALKGITDFNEVWKLDEKALDAWQELFEDVEKGRANYIYWDNAPITSNSGVVSFLRHCLTVSVKNPDKLQLTCILVKNGEEIPLGDLQVNLSEFLKETPNRAQVIIE